MVSYFLTKADVIGLNDVIKIIPRIIEIILGIIIIEKFIYYKSCLDEWLYL